MSEFLANGPPVLKLSGPQILEELDKMIEYWRTEKRIATEQAEISRIQMARNYIDAYQSVRVNLFGEIKPL